MRSHLLLILVSILTFASLDQPASAQAERPAAPALRVDGVEISAETFAEWLVGNMGEKQARVFALDDYVVEREARRLGLAVEPPEIDARVQSQIAERIRGAFFGKREEWLAELARTGHSEAGIVRLREVEARTWLAAEKIAGADRVVPEDKIEREWWKRAGRKGRKLDLLLMKFKVETTMPAVRTKEAIAKAREDAMESGRQRALAARARIVAGEDFGKLARELSEDPETRDRRGALVGGWRHDDGWSKPFLAAVDVIQPGELSEPLYAKGGFWLVQCRGVVVTPLDSVRAEIAAELLARGPEDDEVVGVVKRLQANVQVEVLPALWDPPRDSERPAALEPAVLIDGDPVARGTYLRWLVDKEGEGAVGRFVEEWAVERRARERGVEVSDEELAARIQEWIQMRIDEAFDGRREMWVTWLALQKRSEESFLRELRRRLHIDLLSEKMIVADRKVTRAAIESRYAEQFGAEGERLEIRWIVVLIRTPVPAPDATREELENAALKAGELARTRAASLAERIRKGEDFAAVAKSESDDAATRELGGRIEGRFRADRYPDEISTAVRKLRDGEVTDPLLYGSAYVVMQVAERRNVKLEEAAPEIEKELASERPTLIDLAGFRNGLVQKLEVEVLPGMFGD